RLAAAAAASTGFLYYVSRLGVTGEKAELAPGLAEGLARAKAAAGALPVAAGFGISTPEQAAAAARSADGVVVGSALTRLLGHADPDVNGARLKELASALAGAMGRTGC
ncbi:MAG: tryptophan synthase subunit alpha, partial [Elusimicrobia bacterium]|nr:tryptophan synthase subunit alpha [Elusimicrobiota bacterium]